VDQALRPMSTAQVLDRTFFLYRRNFWLFAGIAGLPPAFLLVAQLIGLMISSKPDGLAGSVAGIAAIGIGVIVGVVVYVIGYALATGASVYAVSRAHLGQTTTIAQAYRSVRNRVRAIIGTSIGVGLLFAFAGGILVLLTAGLTSVLIRAMGMAGWFIMVPVWAVEIFFLIKFALRYSIAVPACVLEKLDSGASMTRSFSLAQGAEGKLFLIVLLNTVIVVALTLVLSIPTLVGTGLAAAKGTPAPISYQVMQMLASFLASTLSGPISIIAFSLVYYDQRVRKEAFDLTLMMEAIGQAHPPMAMSASAGTPSSIG
jgi:hypothetical protein